jgi:uncharacterized membrane protein HdeD (DUF308 family)
MDYFLICDARQWLQGQLATAELALWARVLPLIRLASRVRKRLHPALGWWWMPISGLAVGTVAALVSRLVE